MTDPKTDLRDRIRRVLAQSDGFDFDSLEPHDYQIQAAAIAAVLPPPADRAAVLLEARDVARAEAERLEMSNHDARAARGARSVAYLLRRLAAEAQQQPAADDTDPDPWHNDPKANTQEADLNRPQDRP